MPSTTMTLYPSASLAAEIESNADELGVSNSEWLCEAARQKLQREKDLGEEA